MMLTFDRLFWIVCFIIHTSLIEPNSKASNVLSNDNIGSSNVPDEKQHEKETHASFPNFIIFFADNLGYDDVSYFRRSSTTTTASERQQKHTGTPNIDTLIGEKGLKLNHWNSIGHLCSASRASLLTGQYPIRSGIYPGVFKPDASNGLPYNVSSSNPTIASILKEHYPQYTTSIIGKWHLGHTSEYLPTKHHGFDEWIGIPYHMSGGSLDNHVCNYDVNSTMNLPLYKDDTIIEQPVELQKLADTYSSEANRFIQTSLQQQRPFFLYMSFSHVHQLCPPRPKQNPDNSSITDNERYCQWSSKSTDESSFDDAVTEMDWIVGRILNTTIDVDENIQNNTIIIFTSDNGPWIAEQDACSGSKGPFQGQWLRDNVDSNCTACPHDYVSDPTVDRPRRCNLTSLVAAKGTAKVHDEVQQRRLPSLLESLYNSSITSVQDDSYISFDESLQTAEKMIDSDNDIDNVVVAYTDGIHCGEDTGLGSTWEANLRMPALMRWTGTIEPGTETDEMVSTIDVVPTVLSIIQKHHVKNQKDNNVPPVVDEARSLYKKAAINIFDGLSSNEDDEKNHGLPYKFDGVDISGIFQKHLDTDKIANDSPQFTKTMTDHGRILYFWRDGFVDGPLQPPFGRYDIVAVKIEPFYKLWFYTKSSHYNLDPHVYHDPPLIFNVDIDPAEAFPLPITNELIELIQHVKVAIQKHKESIEWTYPLTLDRDPKNIPCVNQDTKCRTTTNQMTAHEKKGGKLLDVFQHVDE